MAACSGTCLPRCVFVCSVWSCLVISASGSAAASHIDEGGAGSCAARVAALVRLGRPFANETRAFAAAAAALRAVCGGVVGFAADGTAQTRGAVRAPAASVPGPVGAAGAPEDAAGARGPFAGSTRCWADSLRPDRPPGSDGVAWRDDADGALLWSDGGVCGTPNWSGAQHFLDAFSGRTLLVMGDSMVNALAMGIADMLQPHLRRNMTQVTSSCHLQMTDKSMLMHCAAYDRGFLLCSLRNVEAAYSSPGAAWRTEQALAGNLQPSDVVIANLGIHFKYSAIQDLKDLRRLTMAVLDYFKTKDEPGPLLFWLETAAQHFPRGVFDPKGKRGAGGVCVDLTSGSAGWRATVQRDLRGPYNAVTNPLAARAGIAVVRLFEATLPLFERHAAKGDCSHFRTADDGPYRFVAQRIATLAHHATAAGALPHPPPFDDAALRGRWSRLMENSDSVLAKIAQCAVPDSAEKFRWRWRGSCPSTPPAVRKCVCEQERRKTCVTAATNLKANLCYPNPNGQSASNGLMCAGAPAHRFSSVVLK